jgi:indoleamine 2,3-dioxygenase
MCLCNRIIWTDNENSAGFKPFMEYAGSYALFNYRLVDSAKGLEYDNLRLIRAFEAGLDPSSSEAGFVLVHIAMVKESGSLVKGAAEMLESCAARDRERFNDGLRTLVGGLDKVNAVMNSKILASILHIG